MTFKRVVSGTLHGLRTGIAFLAMAQLAIGLPAAQAQSGAANDNKTTSPIKHLIVIMGENRSFDHVFATYMPGRGESVDNLLSKGIINSDGTPGPNYAKAAQYSAMDNNFYSINPGQKTLYDNNLQPPGTSYAFKACYSDIMQAALDGPGCLTSVILAAQADYGLRPQDLPLLTTGATGLAPGSP